VTNRRDFFQQAAALTAGPRLLGTLLAAVDRASAIDPADNTTFLDAEHVVILMQENRSFDHMFGALRGVRGFNDPRAVTLPNQKPVWMQANAAGETYAPFRLDIKDTKATWLGSLPHSWPDQTDARSQGNHDGWLDAKRSSRADCAHLPFTMGYYDREDLPFYYAFADAFTICDQHFCSSLTATTPNRLQLWTGTVREKPDANSPPNVRNSDVDYGSTVRWKTFPERLEEAGVSWRVYQNELSLPSGLEGEHDAWLTNFTDNPLEWFEQYHVELRKTHREFLERTGAKVPPETPLSASAVSLHEKAFTTNEDDPAYRELSTLEYRDGDSPREMQVPKGDPLHRFRADVAAGKLPAVSWLVPSERFSDHPGSPWYGSWYVAEALNILTSNPEIWRRTIFILTYDENDGYFDHVPPFVAPDPGNPESGKVSPELDAALEYLPLAQDLKRHPAKNARGGPVGLGFRVPLIVASPWSRGGYVCSQVFDHTSVIQLLERLTSRQSGKDIRETNITAWRRTVSGDLSSAFRPFQSGSAAIAFPPRDTFLEQIHRAQFTRMPSGYGQPWVPRQEPGLRPSAALPYQLSASGALSSDRTRFEIVLEAGKAAGAPFHVYTPGTFRGRTDLRTRAYAVTAGSRLDDDWELEGFENRAYHLRVCGPNGFLREFAGNPNDPELQIACEYTASGNLRIHARNRTERPVRLRLNDESYGARAMVLNLKPGQDRSTELDLSKSHRWYDLSIAIEGNAPFLRRYAGRVEIGKDGFSDPAFSRPA